MLWNFFYQPQYIVVSQEHNPGQLFWFFLKNSAWRGRFLSKKVPEFCKLQRSVHRNRKYEFESPETGADAPDECGRENRMETRFDRDFWLMGRFLTEWCPGVIRRLPRGYLGQAGGRPSQCLRAATRVLWRSNCERRRELRVDIETGLTPEWALKTRVPVKFPPRAPCYENPEPTPGNFFYFLTDFFLDGRTTTNEPMAPGIAPATTRTPSSPRT